MNIEQYISDIRTKLSHMPEFLKRSHTGHAQDYADLRQSVLYINGLLDKIQLDLEVINKKNSVLTQEQYEVYTNFLARLTRASIIHNGTLEVRNNCFFYYNLESPSIPNGHYFQGHTNDLLECDSLMATKELIKVWEDQFEEFLSKYSNRKKGQGGCLV